ncbi:MAG: response regulator transcription factor [Rhodospirillales bacterium]
MLENSPKILIIDDDPGVRDVVTHTLTREGYHITALTEGRNAHDTIRNNKINLAIVDLVLPDTDGLSLTRALKEHFDIGLLILSGKGDVMDKVVGLEIGADDYLAKPFDPRELLARVRSVLRRSMPKQADMKSDASLYAFNGWSLDMQRRILVSAGNKEADLSGGEFTLLKAFVEHPNRVLSRKQIIEFTHHTYTPAHDRSVDVQVGRLRKKIEANPKKPQIIKTVRHSGYMFLPKVIKLPSLS